MILSHNTIHSLAWITRYSSKCLRQASIGSSAIRSAPELKAIITAKFIELAITERDQRLLALQDRWDAVRAAKTARANGDYAAMMRTGVVACKIKSVQGPKGRKLVKEYELDTGMIDALNSIEKRAAIETGQEQENINVSGHVTNKAVALSKIMTIPELEALEAKMLAEIEKEKNAGGKLVVATAEAVVQTDPFVVQNQENL